MIRLVRNVLGGTCMRDLLGGLTYPDGNSLGNTIAMRSRLATCRPNIFFAAFRMFYVRRGVIYKMLGWAAAHPARIKTDVYHVEDGQNQWAPERR